MTYGSANSCDCTGAPVIPNHRILIGNFLLAFTNPSIFDKLSFITAQ